MPIEMTSIVTRQQTLVPEVSPSAAVAHAAGSHHGGEVALKRPVLIDACNVGHTHAGPRREYVSCVGILLAVRHFIANGHQVKTFIPLTYRFHGLVRHREILDELKSFELLAFTPARRVGSEESSVSVKAYDDLYIIQDAHKTGGVVVSNDAYIDVLESHPEWKDVILNRKLQINFWRDKGGAPHVFKSDEFGRRRNPGEVLMCEPGTPDYPLVRHNQVATERREFLLNSIDQLLAKIAENPQPPPNQTDRPQNPRPGFSRQKDLVDSSRSSSSSPNASRRFTRLPVTAFLKMDSSPESSRRNATGFRENFHRMKEQEREEVSSKRSESRSREEPLRGEHERTPEYGETVESDRSASGTSAAHKETDMRTGPEVKPSVVSCQDPFDLEFLLSPALSAQSAVATESPEAAGNIQAGCSAAAATWPLPLPLLDHGQAETREDSPRDVQQQRGVEGGVVEEEDYLSDNELVLMMKLSEIFDPLLIRRAMKENPSTRAVMALANLIYDKYSDQL